MDLFLILYYITAILWASACSWFVITKLDNHFAEIKQNQLLWRSKIMANFKELNDKVNALATAVDAALKKFQENADDSVDQAAVDDLETRLQDIRDKLDAVEVPVPVPVPAPSIE